MSDLIAELRGIVEVCEAIGSPSFEAEDIARIETAIRYVEEVEALRAGWDHRIDLNLASATVDMIDRIAERSIDPGSLTE